MLDACDPCLSGEPSEDDEKGEIFHAWCMGNNQVNFIKLSEDQVRIKIEASMIIAIKRRGVDDEP